METAPVCCFMHGTRMIGVAEERKHKGQWFHTSKPAAIIALLKKKLSMTLVRANVRALLSRAISGAGYSDILFCVGSR